MFGVIREGRPHVHRTPALAASLVFGLLCAHCTTEPEEPPPTSGSQAESSVGTNGSGQAPATSGSADDSPENGTSDAEATTPNMSVADGPANEASTSPSLETPESSNPDAPATGMPEAGSGAADRQPPSQEVPTDGSVPPPPYTNPGFENLAPPLGDPLDMTGTALEPPAPTGWTWYQIEGAMCRDGSPTGFFLRRGTANKLLLYLEGGGACSNLGFCGYNPANANQLLAGDGQTVLGSALGAVAGRQQPGAYTGGIEGGIFDTTNADNPFGDWHQIYVPYCTGDVHFGTRKDGMVPGLTIPQQFVGYENMKRFVARIVPTFAGQVDQVVLSGASAGGFGASLNFSMVQDAFGDNAHVLVLDDSGPPFNDQFMPVCMQKRWREAWGFSGSMPPDCTECQQADGGGLAKLADFMLRKHPHARVALISSMEDEIIRLFYSVGLVDCANYDTADPVAITLLQTDPTVYFPAQQYSGGLNRLRTDYSETGRFGSYFMSGLNLTMHQHTFRQRFYEAAAGGVTIASFVKDFLAGESPIVGPM